MSKIRVLSDEEVREQAEPWVTHKVIKNATCAVLPNSEKPFDEEENFESMEKQDEAFDHALNEFEHSG